MDKQKVIFKDLGIIEYKAAWDYQETLLNENVQIKSAIRNAASSHDSNLTTTNYFLLCEHPPVYTLGKSGKKENVLMNDDELAANDIAFFNTNRGGDITFHGPQQIVGYPILDLEKYYHVKIALRNQNLANCPHSALLTNQSLENVLDGLVVTYQLKATKLADGEYALTGGQCR